MVQGWHGPRRRAPHLVTCCDYFDWNIIYSFSFSFSNFDFSWRNGEGRRGYEWVAFVRVCWGGLGWSR